MSDLAFQDLYAVPAVHDNRQSTAPADVNLVGDRGNYLVGDVIEEVVLLGPVGLSLKCILPGVCHLARFLCGLQPRYRGV